MNIEEQPKKFTSTKRWRWLGWEPDTNRMEVAGLFTATDLRKLADWLDIPDKGEGNVINVKLSEL